MEYLYLFHSTNEWLSYGVPLPGYSTSEDIERISRGGEGVMNEFLDRNRVTGDDDESMMKIMKVKYN